MIHPVTQSCQVAQKKDLHCSHVCDKVPVVGETK